MNIYFFKKLCSTFNQEKFWLAKNAYEGRYISYAFVLTCLFCEAVDEMTTAESLQFDFSTIRDATNNFAEENKIGQGGFGSVYKVTLN